MATLPNDLPPPLTFSITDARRELGGMGETKIHELMNEGRLTRVKIGRRTLITAQSIRNLIADGVA